MTRSAFKARSAGQAAWGVLAVLAGCAAMTVCAPRSVAAPARTFSTLTTSFSPDRLGARGALTFSTHYADGEPDVVSPSGRSSVPSAVRKLVVRFPAGMGLEIPDLRGCSAARLRAHGLRGCPAAARIGGGYAITRLHAGTQILSEHITLSAFVGPLHNGQPTLLIFAQGYTPLGERLVFGGEMLFAHAPYGEELVLRIPPIHTLPAAPDASPTTFSLTLGVSAHRAERSHGAQRRSRSANTVIVPSHCPPGGFPFASESTFADGSSDSAVTAARCPR